MAFFYEGGSLRCGSAERSADVETIARASGTPLYLYDLDAVRTRYRALLASLGGLRSATHYAVKANPSPVIVKALADLGAGADVVSAGEIHQATAGGVDPNSIIFSGVGKTVREIHLALEAGIKQLNVESPQELARISAIATACGKVADVAFRMNPDVSPETHPYITTGFRENKFGMDESFLPELLEIVRSSGGSLRLRGLTLHIGSQILDISSMRDAIRKTKSVFNRLRAEGQTQMDRFDVGGGVGIDYATDDETRELGILSDYGAMIEAELSDLCKTAGCEILLEPGRILVGRAGILVSEIQYIKRAPAKTFAVVDAGMHTLLRPALYQAQHRVLPIRSSPSEMTGRASMLESVDVVGPICESSDVLARSVMLPPLKQGDFLALADAGAYGRSMSSAYNAHPFPAEAHVSAGVASISESIKFI